MMVQTLIDTLRRLNRLRLQGEGARQLLPAFTKALPISVVERLNRAERSLATYHFMGLGQSHHAILDDLAGEWQLGSVRGRQYAGEDGRLTGMVWRPDGEPLPVQLFLATGLPAQWDELDRRVGASYIRILVPVEIGRSLHVANLYALRQQTAEDLG